MNKSVKIALAASALALAYPAASWVLGQQIESALDEQYAMLDKNPFVKVVQRDYQRGIFSSTETVSIEFFGEMMKAAMTQQQGPAGAAMKPIRISLRSEIRHGPLPGGTTLAAAVADSELILDDEAGKQLASVLGDKKPLVAHTVYRFDRGGVATLSSPAFSTALPGEEGEAPGKLAWDGLTMSVDFARGMASYSFQAAAPKLEFTDGKRVHFQMTALSASSEQKRVFDDEPMLYAGSQKYTIGQIDARDPNDPGKDNGAVLLKNLSYLIDVPVNGDFLDMAAKIGAEVVQVGKSNFGPAHYDFSLRHLHARTVAKLHRALLDLYADPANIGNAGDNPAQLFASLGDPAMELLKHSPEIGIDRVSFNSAHGETLLTASAKLNDLKPEEVANPFMLLGKLQAKAEVALPEALIADFTGGGNASDEGEDEDDAEEESSGDAARQQIAALAAQGYIVLDKGMIRSKLEFANGQVTVNGKPFNPMAMGGGMPKKSAMQH